VATNTRNIRIPDGRWRAVKDQAAEAGTDGSKVVNALLVAWLAGDILLEPAGDLLGTLRLAQPSAEQQRPDMPVRRDDVVR